MKTFLVTLLMASVAPLALDSAWAQAPYNTKASNSGTEAPLALNSASPQANYDERDPDVRPGPALVGGSLCANGCRVGSGYGLRVQPKYDQDQFSPTESGSTPANSGRGVKETRSGQ